LYVSIITYIILTLLGAVLWFSPVPFWDMWDGALKFYYGIVDKNYSLWFAQHNEHKIFLSRLLFYIEFKFFNGSFYFLYIINFFLAGCSFLFFYFILVKNLIKLNSSRLFSLASIAFVFFMIFSWIQYQNLIWVFQSQFFLAQNVPLASLISLYKYKETGNDFFFSLGAFLAFISIYTMANGLFILPIALCFLIITKTSIKKIFIISFLTVLAFVFILYNYKSPPGHSSIVYSLLTKPVQLLDYVLIYIGAPVYYLFGRISLWLPRIAGVVFLLLMLYVLLRELRLHFVNRINLILILYVLYIGATIFITAGGRVGFGVAQALSLRYNTPALMIWVSLFILFLKEISEVHKNFKPSVLFLPLMLFVLLKAQFMTFNTQRNIKFEQLMGAIALELDIPDYKYLSRIVPNADLGLEIARRASKENLSIFNHPLIKDLKQKIFSNILLTPEQKTGVGALDDYESISDSDFIRARGWYYDQKYSSVPKKVFLLKGDTIVGYGLTGVKREDVSTYLGTEKSLYSGFEAYISSQYLGQTLRIVSGDRSSFTESKLLIDFKFTLTDTKIDSNIKTLSTNSIKLSNNWNGTDYSKSTFKGLKTLGSYITSDSDTGSIILHMKKSDKLVIKTGPKTNGQRIIIDDKFMTRLPVISDWSSLSISDARISDNFEVQLIDNSSSWGEWTSILLKDN
jgi:hypothetical protein